MVKSPREAAIGVAILSGSMFICLDNNITATITKLNKKLAIDAVTKALAHNRNA